MKMQSLDVTGSNIDKIAKLFPQCVTEHKDKDGKTVLGIDFEKLRDELSADVIDEGEERYQFTWPDKKAHAHLANTPTTKTLRPCREESVDFDHTQNLYIEGDNLDVLKVIRETYLGKVKIIYIDPPYNTGNDFVYNDDFSQDADEYRENSGQLDEEGNRLVQNTESNGRFHTDWLNMIYPRLKVAKDLLSEDGVIFISIDDNEVENLRKICDEIFGQHNFIACFAWINSLKDEIDEDIKFAGSNLGTLKKAHEYICAYGKSDYHLPLDLPSSKYIEKLITKGGNNVVDLCVPKGLKCSEKISKVIKGHVGGTDDYYDIVTDEGMIIKNGVLQNDILIRGPLGNAQMLSRYFSGEEIIDRKGQKLIEVYIAPNGMLQTKKLRAGDTPSTVLIGKGTTKNGTLSLKKMFGKKVFDYSKPVELINYLLTKQQVTEFTVLDFFSGSATTAHSVFSTNILHQRRIKFILVQIPEIIDPDAATSPKSKSMLKDAKDILEQSGHPANICELAKERIRRAGKKIKEEAGLQGQDLDIGFRVLKLDSSNMQDVYYMPKEFTERNLFADNVKSDRTPEDLLFQVMLDLGVELSATIDKRTIDGKRVFFVNDNYLVACFDENIAESTITEIAKMKPYYFVMRDSSLASDNVADNFDQLFETYSKDTIRKII